MSPKLYMITPSPPVRAVQMLASKIGLELELIEIDLVKKDHLKPEYIKMNPQHTVPTLIDDDGFTLWDSHAIMIYLVSKYAKNDALYPTEYKKRAIIDQRLHFDSGVLWARILKILRPIIYSGKKTVDQEDKDGLDEIYGFLETFLDGRKWIAVDFVTIADYSLITSLLAANLVHKVDPTKFPKLVDWSNRVQALPEYAVSQKGQQMLNEWLQNLLQ